MSKKTSHQSITFESIIRLLIFLAILYFVGSALTTSPKPQPTTSSKVLGEITSSITSSTPYQQLSQKFDPLFKQLVAYPQNYLNQLKKDIIKKVSDSLIQSID